MKMDDSFKTIFTAMMIVSGLVACDNSGPAEKAGKQIDQATENATNSLSNAAEKADQAISKQANETTQVMEDSAVTSRVKSSLLREPGMQSMKIKVVTENGIVTLSGTAETQEKIDKANKLASAIDGVKSVKNKLVIAN
jgi:hyperosmotically inducible protein